MGCSSGPSVGMAVDPRINWARPRLLHVGRGARASSTALRRLWFCAPQAQKVLVISPGLKIYRQAHGYQRSVDQIFDSRCGVLQREITGLYHNAQALRPNFRGPSRVNALRRSVTDYLLFQMNHGYIRLNWVDSDKGIAFEVHQVVQPPSHQAATPATEVCGLWGARPRATKISPLTVSCWTRKAVQGSSLNTCRIGLM